MFKLLKWLLITVIFFIPSALAKNYDLSGLKPYLSELNDIINANIKKYHIFEQSPNCVAKINPCKSGSFGVLSCSQCIDANVKTTITVRYISVDIINNQIIVSGRMDISSRMRGRGEIGRHIQETASGTIDPRITFRFTQSEGKIKWRYSSDWHWHKTPKLDLFGFIPVTIESLADDAVSDMMNSFDSELNAFLKRVSF